MSSNDDGPVDRALGWILAIGILLASGLKWLLLWPYEVLRTYLGIGQKRREAAEDDRRSDAGGDEHRGDETGDEGRDGGAH